MVCSPDNYRRAAKVPEHEPEGAEAAHRFGTFDLLAGTAAEENMPRGDKSKYPDKQERKADHIVNITRVAGFQRGRPNDDPGPPSTRTTATARRRADRAEESQPATPRRTKRQLLPLDRRAADRTQPGRPRLETRSTAVA